MLNFPNDSLMINKTFRSQPVILELILTIFLNIFLFVRFRFPNQQIKAKVRNDSIQDEQNIFKSDLSTFKASLKRISAGHLC